MDAVVSQQLYIIDLQSNRMLANQRLQVPEKNNDDIKPYR